MFRACLPWDLACSFPSCLAGPPEVTVDRMHEMEPGGPRPFLVWSTGDCVLGRVTVGRLSSPGGRGSCRRSCWGPSHEPSLHTGDQDGGTDGRPARPGPQVGLIPGPLAGRSNLLSAPTWGRAPPSSTRRPPTLGKLVQTLGETPHALLLPEAEKPSLPAESYEFS